jgi:hypothetical protein
MQRILLANRSQRVQENAAAKLAEGDAATKVGKLQATFSEARKAAEEEAQKVLDEEIAKMVSEGGPTCGCGEGSSIAVGQGPARRHSATSFVAAEGTSSGHEAS